MKRQIIGTLLLIVLCLGKINAQNDRALTKADKMYSIYSYADAVNIYKELYEESPSDPLALKIATCHFKMNQLTESKSWYDKVSDKAHMSHEHHLHYGDVLESVGDYEGAARWYEVYQVEESQESRAKEKLYGATHIKDFYADSARYKVSSLPTINTEYSDFSPAYFGDGFVFPSSRIHELGSKHTFKWDNSAFLDLYYTQLDTATNDYGTPSFFDVKLNTKFHEGPLAFDKTGTKVIFTRNNYFKSKKHKSDDKVMKLKLYYADRDTTEEDEHGWGHFIEFPYNNDEYSVGHPTVTQDFSLLVFASNQPGGLGGTDLYFSRYEDQKWTTPVNLGKEINTEGDDMFPYLHEDGTLYYASNGHGGLGGLDIYEATPVKSSSGIDLTKTYEVKDLGYPINSSKDDFGLIMNAEKSVGYFSSNREGGQGSDDIYKVIVKSPPVAEFVGITYVNLEGAPKENRKLLPETFVTVYKLEDGKEEEIGRTTSDSDGKFTYPLTTGSKYKFVGDKDTLTPDELIVDITEKKDKETIIGELTLREPLPDVVRLCVKVVDIDKNRAALEGATVYVMEEGGKEVQVYVTDKDGTICLTLLPNKNYVMKSTKVKYLADCFTLNSGELTKAAKTPERPLELEQLKVSQKFRYDKILFDLAKHNIRKDAAIELDKVVEFIKAHPGITVELGAHTDARGSDAYNEALSERRAKSSREYIVSQGIGSEMITSKGYGETQLTNKCGNGVRCNEALHQANRRTEIKITGIKDMSPEEEARLQASIKGLEPNGDYSEDCDTVKVKEVK